MILTLSYLAWSPVTEPTSAIFLAMVTCGALLWALLVWPSLLRRVFAQPHGGSATASDAIPLVPAPDRGLAALGWLLFGHAVVSLTIHLPVVFAVLTTDDISSDWQLSQQFASFEALRADLWWLLGVSALELVAAWQLVELRPHHRRVATLWGVAAACVAAWIHAPWLVNSYHLHWMWQHHGIPGAAGAALMLLPSVMALVVPIITVLVVRRTQPVMPTAQLRR